MSTDRRERQIRFYDRRRARGVCVTCAAPSRVFVRCLKCRQARSKRWKREGKR